MLKYRMPVDKMYLTHFMPLISFWYPLKTENNMPTICIIPSSTSFGFYIMRHFKSLATNEAKTPPNHRIAKDFTKSLKIDTTHVPKFSYTKDSCQWNRKLISQKVSWNRKANSKSNIQGSRCKYISETTENINERNIQRKI